MTEETTAKNETPATVLDMQFTLTKTADGLLSMSLRTDGAMLQLENHGEITDTLGAWFTPRVTDCLLEIAGKRRKKVPLEQHDTVGSAVIYQKNLDGGIVEKTIFEGGRVFVTRNHPPANERPCVAMTVAERPMTAADQKAIELLVGQCA